MGEQIVCIITAVKFPVLVVNFRIGVHHKSGLHMISDMSLHLQKLMTLRK